MLHDDHRTRNDLIILCNVGRPPGHSILQLAGQSDSLAFYHTSSLSVSIQMNEWFCETGLFMVKISFPQRAQPIYQIALALGGKNRKMLLEKTQIAAFLSRLCRNFPSSDGWKKYHAHGGIFIVSRRKYALKLGFPAC